MLIFKKIRETKNTVVYRELDKNGTLWPDDARGGYTIGTLYVQKTSTFSHASTLEVEIKIGTGL